MIYPPIYILRHGQTEWNVEGRMQGRRDSALTPLGRSQAADQAQVMSRILYETPDLALYSSPLGRAVETAKIAYGGRSFAEDTRIAEVYVGSWEGRLRADVVAEIGRGVADEAAMFDLFMSAPDGENAQVIEDRCRAFLDSLEGPSAIVSHGVVSALLRGIVLGLPREEIALLSHRQGCVWQLKNGEEVCLLPDPAAAAQS